VGPRQLRDRRARSRSDTCPDLILIRDATPLNQTFARKLMTFRALGDGPGNRTQDLGVSQCFPSRKQAEISQVGAQVGGQPGAAYRERPGGRGRQPRAAPAVGCSRRTERW